MDRECHLGVDVGGTFTDLAFFDGSGRLTISKMPSTPAAPGQSTLNGLDELIASGVLDEARLADLHHTHGSTIAINTLIERRGVDLGLLVTEGFRDVFELGRLALPHPMRYDSRRPEPLIPRSRVQEVVGRLDANGREVTPLDPASVIEAVGKLNEQGAELIVVCFLHSYRDPVHERRAAEIVRDAYPDLPIELSSDTWPQAREYERAVLGTINAYVRPAIEGYLDRLIDGIKTRRITTEPRVIRSNGGMQRAATIRRAPVHALLSGPAAGVVASANVAAAFGWTDADLITVDVGGTSVDVGVVRNGLALLSSEEHVADFPLLTPGVAVSSVGAGGGSIVWLDETNTLKVGPRSAGAEPGPACYGFGSEQPTLTDAFLLAGWLENRQKLGGRIEIDADASRAAFLPYAEKLGQAVEEVADNAITLAIAVIAVETSNVLARRGVDAPDFGLVAFGGAGPLIGAMLAEDVYVDTVLIPPAPGVLSALGAAGANVEGDLIRPVYQRMMQLPREHLPHILEVLDRSAAQWLDEEGSTLPIVGRDIRYCVDMRYVGQGYDVTVEVEAEWLRDDDRDRLTKSFHDAHYAAYGHADETAETWLKEVRAHVVGFTPNPEPAQLEEGKGVRPIATRTLRVRGEMFDAAVYDRAAFGAGDTFDGPAIVDQLDTTTFVPLGWRAEVMATGTMRLSRDTPTGGGQ